MSLEKDLRRLGMVAAPDALYSNVMNELGLGDQYGTLETALGPVRIAFNRRGISAVYSARSPEVFERWFNSRFGRPLRPAEKLPERLLAKPLRFDLRGCSEFEQAVLRKALEIPKGEVRSYAWIAREIGRPAAVRAVGTALAHNPIPVLIPCHRVVRSDGLIGNYSLGGPDAKRTILRSEGLEPDRLEKLAKVGVRYQGSDTTHIFCMPTCRYGRRVMDRHRVDFHSEAEARERGYRPCKVCRPAI